MKTFAPLLAALALAAGAAPALAQSTEPMRMTIDLAGIDLTTAKGQEIADRKIERAVSKACGVRTVRTGTRIPSSETAACLAKARAAARQQLAALTEDQRRGG